METPARTTEQSPPDPDALSFEEALSLLEQIVAQLEGGDLPLDRAIEEYQTGMRLVRACRERLRAAEQRIEMVTAAEQGAQVRPFALEEERDGDR